MMVSGRSIRWLSLVALGLAELATAATAWAEKPGRVVVVEGTLEAALGHPRVHVRVRRHGKVLTATAAAPDETLALFGVAPSAGPAGAGGADRSERSFVAYFDTGASACVLTRATATRFGIALAPNSAYHEFGLHGETRMAVSEPHGVDLADAQGTLADSPGRFRQLPGGAVFEINLATPDGVMALAAGEMNVIGMPALQKWVVELDPAPLVAGSSGKSGGLEGLGNLGNLESQLAALAGGETLDLEAITRLVEGKPGADGRAGLDLSALSAELRKAGVGPAVRLHPAGFSPPGRVIEIPLAYRDYARHLNPADRGPQPTLAPNPVLVGVETERADKRFRGDWLLDTGAAASLISTAQARALGLVSEDGTPVQPVAFELPLGGIGGQISRARGFVVERLRIRARGATVEYRDVRLLVHDVVAKLDDGQVITLDGVFGNNLLLPSAAGLSAGIPSALDPGPWQRLYFDGPGKRLLLVPRRRPASIDLRPAPR